MALDLNLYRVFAAIWSEGSLTRAGAVLHRSQPAVSHALARLRAHFGDELFVRVGHRLGPTPLARRLIHPVREALARLDAASTERGAFDPSRDAAEFRLALRDLLESTALPQLVVHLRRVAPKVVLSTARVARERIPARLAEGSLDVALDVPFPVGEAVRVQELRRDRFVVLAAAAQHPRLDARGYLSADHVLVSSRETGPAVEDYGLRRLGHRRRIAMRCQTCHAAVQAVADSDLLLTLPEGPARRIAARMPTLAVHPVPLPIPPVRSCMYWHQRSDADPASVFLRRQIAALLSSPAPGD